MDLIYRDIKILLIIGSNPATVSFTNHFISNTKFSVIGLMEQFEGITYPKIHNRKLKTKNLPPTGKAEDILGNEWNRIYLGNNINTVMIKKGSIRKKRWINWIKDLKPDVIVSHGPERLPEEILKIPKYCGINIHWGLSPYYRGMHTSLWPILEGHMQYVGLTIHMLDKKLDTGPIIYQSRPEILPYMTYKQIEYSLTNIAKRKIDKCISFLIENYGKIPQQQKEIGKCYLAAEWTQREQEKIEDQSFISNQVNHYLSNKENLDKDVKLINLLGN